MFLDPRKQLRRPARRTRQRPGGLHAGPVWLACPDGPPGGPKRLYQLGAARVSNPNRPLAATAARDQVPAATMGSRARGGACSLRASFVVRAVPSGGGRAASRCGRASGRLGRIAPALSFSNRCGPTQSQDARSYVRFA
jgi:hypothetical protein